MYRYIPIPGGDAPIEIDFEEAETTAVVVLLDNRFAANTGYIRYIEDTTTRAELAGLRARVFPVIIDNEALQTVRPGVQAIRWDHWGDDKLENRRRKLISQLTYEFCRMLRHYLEHLRHPKEPEEALAQYLEKVRIFLSHSKHDAYGESIARDLREAIYQGSALASFFDVLDIPPGLTFSQVLLHYVRVSAVIAIHTDSYSSQEWCRREIIEAKRANKPLVVANCISNDCDPINR
jgi:hypothetical protein